MPRTKNVPKKHEKEKEKEKDVDEVPISKQLMKLGFRPLSPRTTSFQNILEKFKKLAKTSAKCAVTKMLMEIRHNIATKSDWDPEGAVRSLIMYFLDFDVFGKSTGNDPLKDMKR